MNQPQNHIRAMVAMSGGVDSAVAAIRMRDAGYDVTGVTMKLYRDGEPDPHLPGYLPGEDSDDIRDARAVAGALGIPHEVAHLEAEFCRCVVDPFVRSYLAGETPNPCVTCNRTIKFGALLGYAADHGMEIAATGHYARIERDANGRCLVRRAADESKDQTYMLWSLSQETLARVRFPLGELKKKDVREIAAAHGLANAHKGDSQDICFLPDGDYAGFLTRYASLTPCPGDFVDLSGNVLGKHRGLIHYTVGQRKGLGIAFGEPMYVHSKNAAANTVTLCGNDALFSRSLTAHSANWIVPVPDARPFRAEAKVRYQHAAAPATVLVLEGGRLSVTFDEPQRAIARGQSVVFYDGDLLLGGGIIE